MFNEAKKSHSARLSQNYIKNPSLANYLVRLSSITREDIVLEIGPGKGAFTHPLLNKAKAVYAVEKDPSNFESLKALFKDQERFVLTHGDALDYKVDFSSYKMFANLPFSITSKILQKYLLSLPFPLDSYFVMQKESADRYLGSPYATSISILFQTLYKIEVLHKFRRSDFSPVPGVETVLVRFKLKKYNFPKSIDISDYQKFLLSGFGPQRSNLKNNLRDIFTYAQFMRLSKDLSFDPKSLPSTIAPETWLKIYEFYLQDIAPKKLNQ